MIDINNYFTLDRYLSDYKKLSENRYIKFTNYISIYRAKVIKIDDRRHKVIVKVNTNYRKPYQFTVYFLDNIEVRSDKRDYIGTREELQYWKNN